LQLVGSGVGSVGGAHPHIFGLSKVEVKRDENIMYQQLQKNCEEKASRKNVFLAKYPLHP